MKPPTRSEEQKQTPTPAFRWVPPSQPIDHDRCPIFGGDRGTPLGPNGTAFVAMPIQLSLVVTTDFVLVFCAQVYCIILYLYSPTQKSMVFFFGPVPSLLMCNAPRKHGSMPHKAIFEVGAKIWIPRPELGFQTVYINGYIHNDPLESVPGNICTQKNSHCNCYVFLYPGLFNIHFPSFYTYMLAGDIYIYMYL